MTRDGRERHRWRVGALARDGVEIETEDDVGVVDELEAHRGRDVGVGDAGVDERERSRQVEVVREPLAEELVPAVERDGAERGADALRQARRRCRVIGKLREDADALAEVVEPLGGLAQRGDAEVQACAVMREEALVAEGQRVEAERLDLVDLERVARGLRHLHAVGEQMLAMHPGADDAVSERSFRLRDLVLVMREDVVHAAGVHVETLAEVFRAHRRTLDVPAGKAGSPGRVPHQRAAPRFRALPEGEVRGVALVRIDLGSDALPKRFTDVPRQAAVLRELPHRVVDGPLHDVGETAREQPLDERDHLADVSGGPRIHRRGEDAQPALVLSECRLVELRDLHRGLALRECRRDDLVLAAVDGVLPHVPDVGDVLDGDDAVSEELERAPEPIGEQIRAKIPDVDGSVDRRSTGVHADLARVGRYDRLHAPRQRVVKTYLHAASPVE